MDPTVRQAAATLRAREAEARRRREAREADARSAVEQIVRECVKPPSRVWLIGSLAWGGFGEHSDVDLVFSGVDSAAALLLEKRVAPAAGAPVDFLTFEDLPPSFKERVLATGIKLV